MNRIDVLRAVQYRHPWISLERLEDIYWEVEEMYWARGGSEPRPQLTEMQLGNRMIRHLDAMYGVPEWQR